MLEKILSLVYAGLNLYNEIMNKKENVNCMKCIHFYITWDPKFPKGCNLFGFKTKRNPSETVREATGGDCQNYVKRDT